jgi:bifunctional non-homologous end joining protein LigD
MKNSALEEYAGKRDFKNTREPKPKTAGAGRRAPLFVIQKHAASHLHYDFRLEVDGVLKSWAVPKGVPFSKGEKHLAMRVEDHPFDYARFEGIIAPGNYGAGTVMVWDIGTYEVSGGDATKALKEGKLHLTLHGKKLEGEWTLVKIRHGNERGKDPWLLLKSGESLNPLSAQTDDESALSKRSMKRIAGDQDAEWVSNRAAASTAPARKRTGPVKKKVNGLEKLPAGELGFVVPMYCKLAKTLPQGGGWLYEIKFDGIRAIAIKNGSRIEIYSRLGNDVTARFPEVVKRLEQLQCDKAVLDGEIVALEKSGRSSFQLLQMSRMPGEPRPPICYYVFDLLTLEARDLKSLPLSQRKETLQGLLPEGDEVLRYSASLQGKAAQLLEQIRKRGMEGLIAKEPDSIYEPGRRSGTWLKVKVIQQQEFVIGGYTEPQGARSHFGSLLVGYYKEGRLLFASKVGTGFDHRLLESLYDQFQKLKREECPFANLPEKRVGRYGQGLTASEMKRCTWLSPKLVCEVIYNEWTRDDHLRQPVFAGLREDKKPEEVVREIAQPVKH